MITARELRAHIGRMIQVEGYRGGTLVDVDENDDTIVGLVQFGRGRNVTQEWVDALDLTLIY